ncbi:RDD family protein [Mycobacterium palustre]|uniref:RDD domain-containing protein n=1 Tax=Mycobacterium palustre TaxID=153971 RepID=A0A1X1ZZM5_9MYCO|nr:RDD family protein [Mycobacterium palustre]MCV7099159.1 RDD family protein [Mycobacterium palustre]ORW33381.1 hypothetical protein AWC19_24505 [Mycobacterium palustre]
MTVVVEATPTQPPTTTGPPASARDSLAPWAFRVRAFAVDVLPAIAAATTMALVALTVSQHPVWWWVCVSVGGAAILLMLVNRLLLPALTGWSLGRALSGLAVVRRDGGTVGPWWLLLRDLAHLLDTASVVGWLWPLWDSRRRTFADMLLGTEVRRVDSDDVPAHTHRWSSVAVLGAAAICLGGVAVSYLVAYAPDRASERTQAQIEIQGPKMVAQMLTYDPKTLHDDFARAQSLATDKYRAELVAQQDVVKKGNPVINEYWPTNSSVQSATADRATMLVFLEGRRGVGPDQRYISASVRVDFAKGGDDRWRVDNLSVLTKPKPPGNPK